jgi:hypothetical protein
LSSPFEQVKKWLLDSGLHVTQEQDQQYGGVHSFYDIKDQKFGFLYPEITGYYISMIRFLYVHEKNEQYLNYAKSSADWLVQIYKKYGNIVQGISSDDSQQKFAYSFDISICAKGLLDYYLLSKKEIYLDYAKQMMTSIINEAIDEDGSIRPFKLINSQNFEENKDVWYKQKGCLHIKNAMTFCQLYKILNEKTYLEYAKKICNSCAIYQAADGSIKMHKNENTINLHTLCYALEGLLFTYSITKKEIYLKNCIVALEWCREKIQDDGSIELWFNSKYRAKASYPIAQLIRIMLLIDKMNKQHNYKEDISKLYRFLLTFQSNDEKIQQNGAFYEEIYKSTFGWKMRQRLNSWGSMFALQALFWHDNFDKINFDDEIDLLF